MWNRSIAVLVVVLLAGSSLPLALASSNAMPPSIASHAANDHSCCPGMLAKIPIVLVNLTPLSMPCGGQHPCCAGRGHENPPSLPAVNRSTVSALDGTSAAAEKEVLPTQRSAAPGWSDRTFDFYSLRSTVLRI